MTSLEKIKLVIIGIVIVISVSSASLFVKLTSSAPSVVGFWRLFITLLILGTYYNFKEPEIWRKIYRLSKKILYLSFLSGFFLALHFYTWIWSLRLTPVYVGTTLVDLYPLFATLMAIFFLNEYPSKKVVLGVFLGIFGIILIGVSQGINEIEISRDMIIGSLLAIFGGFSAGVYVVIGRYVRTRIDSLAIYVIPVYVSTTLTLLFLSYIDQQNILMIRYEEIPWLILLAVGPMIGGHTMLNYILRFVKASIASLLIILEPVGAAILAFIFLGEKVPLIGVFGMIMAVSGVMIASLERE